MDRVARLTEIAEHAKVSQATVSRVLNERTGVAEATREAVLTSLDALGYDRPSRLRRKKPKLSRFVGLCVPELTNPIFPAFAQTFEHALARRGLTPVLCTHMPGGTHEEEHVRMLLHQGVAGIIFVSGDHADSTGDPERYRKIRSSGVPIVLVNGYRQEIDAPFVSTDDDASIELSLRHLVHLGHTRIGLAIGPSRYVPVQRKTAAFGRYLADFLGVRRVDDLVEHDLFTVEGGAAAAYRLITKGCTAVVCGSDLMALGAVRAARSMGRRVPEDVSVVGYDDSTLMPFTDPPLTTVRQPVMAMGEAAVQALVDEIRGLPAARTEYLFLPELVVRSSTASPTSTR